MAIQMNGILSRVINDVFLFEKGADLILRWIIKVAAFLIGFSILYNIFFSGIIFPWNIAVSVIILVLPFSLYLQASLNVKAVQEEKISKLQDEFRKMYMKFINQNGVESISIVDKFTLKKLVEDRHKFLIKEKALELNSIYKQAFNDLCADESKLKSELVVERFLEFELSDFLPKIVNDKMRGESMDFSSYLIPLSFFAFIYLSSFLVVIPLISSVFLQTGNSIFIPINQLATLESLDTKVLGIPIIIIQWGILGGFVYTSIGLLNRFLRKDLKPRVYFNASFRLILSGVVAVVIYLLYVSSMLDISGTSENTVPTVLILLAFLAGIAPIQFLIHFADTHLSKLIKGWAKRETVGNRSITQIEGINSVTADRLNEEGIDYIQQLALCNPFEISLRTRFDIDLVADWKDQAILHILTGDISITDKSAVPSSESISYLNNLLNTKLGIRTISAFLILWDNIKVEQSAENFFKSMGILESDSKNLIYITLVFQNIYDQGKKMTTAFPS
jgi:hypothetical protein